MDHDTWMTRHRMIGNELTDVRARRQELDTFREHIPGPLLKARLQDLDWKELALLDKLAELHDLSDSDRVTR